MQCPFLENHISESMHKNIITLEYSVPEFQSTKETSPETPPCTKTQFDLYLQNQAQFNISNSLNASNLIITILPYV